AVVLSDADLLSRVVASPAILTAAAIQSAICSGARVSRGVSGESSAIDTGNDWVVDSGRGGSHNGIRLVPPAPQKFRGRDLIRYRVIPLASLDLVILIR